MIQSPIDSRYQINDDGIWLKKEYVYSINDAVFTMYHHQRMIDVLNADVGHYAGLKNSVIGSCPQLFSKSYDNVYAFGGGLPKFETLLNTKKITILDGMAERVYQQYLEQFRELYKYPGELELIQLIFDSNIISCFEFDKSKLTLFTFCHILEHQSLEEHLAILEKLPKGIDVLVYGPNISKCKDNNWIHIKEWIADHNTFIPYLKMKEIIENFGYTIYFSTEYSDDLLFYFNTGS